MKASDIIETASMSTGYWCEMESAGKGVRLTPAEPGDFEPVTLTALQVTTAIHATLYAHPDTLAAPYIRQALAENDPGMIDGEAADMIIQMAAFGEIVYG